MSDPVRPIAEEELHAYVDGQLDADRRSAVQRYLQDHPEVARQVAAWGTQREALRAAFAPFAVEPIPPRLGLERLVQQRLGRQGLARRRAAAVVLAFGLGGAGGWFLRGDMQSSDAAFTLLAQQAVANHVVYTADLRRPTELGAQQRDDLAGGASRPLGGRLAPTPDGPAGLFMYDGPQGVRPTVFVLPLHASPSQPIQH